MSSIVQMLGDNTRFQGPTEVPVWEVLQSRADWNHGAFRIWEIHLNEYSCWIQVIVNCFTSMFLKKLLQVILLFLPQDKLG